MGGWIDKTGDKHWGTYDQYKKEVNNMAKMTREEIKAELEKVKAEYEQRAFDYKFASKKLREKEKELNALRTELIDAFNLDVQAKTGK